MLHLATKNSRLKKTDVAWLTDAVSDVCQVYIQFGGRELVHSGFNIGGSSLSFRE
jgi:hypothetical protein